MKKQMLSHTLLAIAAILCFACTDDDTKNIGFTTTSGSGHESDSVFFVTIDMGRTVTTATTITYAVSGQAGLDGDYTFITTTDPDGISTTPPLQSGNVTLTVNPGASSARLAFKLIDDVLVEPTREFIYFRITAISDADIAADANMLEYTFEIIDNDTPPANALQADLSWNLGDGVSIGETNFDLLLANHVTLDGNDLVTSANLIDSISSIHNTGTESFQLRHTLPDDEYYIIIRYTSGSKDAALTLIMSHNNVYSRARGNVTAAYTGKMLYYGPIHKSGTSYTSRQSQSIEPAFHFPAR